MDSKAMFQFVFYTLNLCAFLHSIYFDILVVDYPGKYLLDTTLKLTFLNQCMNGFYWTLRWIVLIKTFNTQKSEMTPWSQIGDKFLVGLTLPTGILVACMYWGIRLYDYDLLITPLQKYYIEVGIMLHPWWHNHTIHTLVLLSPLMEVIQLTNQRNVSVIRNSQLILVQLALSFGTLAVIIYYAQVHNYWAYPFFCQNWSFQYVHGWDFDGSVECFGGSFSESCSGTDIGITENLPAQVQLNFRSRTQKFRIQKKLQMDALSSSSSLINKTAGIFSAHQFC